MYLIVELDGCVQIWAENGLFCTVEGTKSGIAGDGNYVT